MKKILFVYALTLLLAIGGNRTLKAQSVAINTDGTTPNSSAILDIKSITKGLLIPRMTTIQRTAIVSPAKGLFVFDNDTNGFWFYNGSSWNNLSAGASSNYWSLSGSDIFTNITGNVGIGTTTPLAKLSVQTGTGNYGILHSDGTVTVGSYVGNSEGWLGTKSNHALAFFTNNSNEQMTLLTNGNFGIGTIDPATKLTIHTPDNTDGFSHESDGGIILKEAIGGVSAAFGTYSPHALRLVTNKVAAMNIEPTGNVGIGTTSPGIYRLKISHLGGGGGLAIENGSTGDNWEFYTYVDLALGKNYLRLSYNNALKGGFVSDNGAYTSVSDERLKTNIKPMAEILGKIKELKPSTYQFKNSTDKQEYNGFIAQDVMKLFPSLVVHNLDPGRKLDVYTMDYSGFGVLAIKGIQELLPMIEDQRLATISAIRELSKLIDAQNKKIAILEEEIELLKEKH